MFLKLSAEWDGLSPIITSSGLFSVGFLHLETSDFLTENAQGIFKFKWLILHCLRIPVTASGSEKITRNPSNDRIPSSGSRSIFIHFRVC
jgi:hypothetical protein